MKTKIFVLAALCTATLLSADQMNQGNSTYQYQNNFKQTPRHIMDDEIAKNVHNVLSGNWLSGGYHNVTFDVNNGTVNLRGVVDTREDKAKVEQAVKKVEGVKNVRSEITVGLPSSQNQKSKMLSMNNTNHNHRNSTAAATMSKDTAGTDGDRTINSRLRERLSRWNPKGYETLVFTTTNGAVVITGNIDRVEDIQRLSNEARNIPGVKSVTNQVTVKKQ